MKLIFAGTPDFSVPALQALVDAGHDIVAVYTQPDRESGRGRKISFGPVKSAALELGLNVEQPASLRDEDAIKTLSGYDADVMIVVAYGLILPENILTLPRFGCINIHASLLPRWRGAAPIQRAIEHGDPESGITIMQMDAGLDTGDILACFPITLSHEETGQSLHDKLSVLGGRAIVDVLADIERYRQQAITQNDEQSTYAAKLHRSESLIDWSDDSINIERKIRAFNPWPLTKTALGETQLTLYNAQNDSTISDTAPGTILAADPSGIVIQCGTGALKITRLQRPGGKPLSSKDFLNGMHLNAGMHLDKPAQ